eukprot:11155624-Lingulodinium_polyedra.AAC.1
MQTCTWTTRRLDMAIGAGHPTRARERARCRRKLECKPHGTTENERALLVFSGQAINISVGNVESTEMAR